MKAQVPTLLDIAGGLKGIGEVLKDLVFRNLTEDQMKQRLKFVEFELSRLRNAITLLMRNLAININTKSIILELKSLDGTLRQILIRISKIKNITGKKSTLLSAPLVKKGFGKMLKDLENAESSLSGYINV